MSEDTREAIIQRFDAALVQMHGCSRYTPEDVDELESAAWDVLPLLKALEPIEPIKHLSTGQICGSCKKVLLKKYKYCPACGKAVKWE